ncbi:MAG: hypothetical protein ACE5EZ_01525 [Thermodesulfobacteriota bacterium]
MSMLNLYALFHCNLAFSLIPREEFPLLIKRCYWPLLGMAEEGVPLGIEMPAWTLRLVHGLDPAFTARLKALIRSGRISLIGSGYAQSIMPLIPAGVNRWNLELGNKYYEEILEITPKIALVNEQTFSAGLVGLYKEAGYEAIIMDWNNCSRHNEYSEGALYSPQKAAGRTRGEEIDLLWSHSIAFQKFGRCVRGDISQSEYLEYLLSHYDDGAERVFPAYSNDAEVFDYRPGYGEKPREDFQKIRELLMALMSEKRFSLLRPEEVLNKFKGSIPHAPIRLQSAETPLVCKKQERYNPLRWSVTGRDSAHINARCLGIFKRLTRLMERGVPGDLDALREKLCEVWGSDYRTNTCDDKSLYLNESLGWLGFETTRLMEEAGLEVEEKEKEKENDKKSSLWSAGGIIKGERQVQDERLLCVAGAAGAMASAFPIKAAAKKKVEVYEDSRRLSVSTGALEIKLMKDRGLALASAKFPEVSERPLLGTLGHGYYEAIELGADFYSGHLIHTDREGRKTTDLLPVQPALTEDERGVRVAALIETPIGILEKEYYIPSFGQEFHLKYRLNTRGLWASSLRLGIFTLMPEAFDKRSIWFETINGGTGPERFMLAGHRLSHEKPVSPAISASGCLGATEGWVSFGDKSRTLRISSDRKKVHTVPMINYRERGDEFFLRLYHSAGELDDTAYWVWRGTNEVSFTVKAEKIS